MKTNFTRFNTFLCAALLLAPLIGCATKSDDKSDDTEKHDKKEATVIELHIEGDAEDVNDTIAVPVGRDNPIAVEVEKDPFMDAQYLENAQVMDEADGLFSIRLKFDWQGTSLLNAETARNPGRRVAVYCEFGKGKEKHFYIASPKITRPISNGIFTFSPAVTHEEAERIVRGLNNVAKQVKKDSPFNDNLFK